MEKTNSYLFDSKLSKKILTCIYPILPKLSLSIGKDLFGDNNFKCWPDINLDLLEENEIKLPIQIQGKFVTTIVTNKNYIEEEILNTIYGLDKIKSKILDKKIIKVINVQGKIINIITN